MMRNTMCPDGSANKNNAMKPRTKAVLLLLLTGLLWSMGGVFIKTSDTNPFVIASFRSLIAALTVFIFLKGKPKFTFSRPQIIGAVAYGFTLNAFVISTSLTTAANAVLLQYASPLWVCIFAFFLLHEKPRRFDIVAIAVILFGVGLLLSNKAEGTSMPGNIIAILSGVGLSLFIVSLRMQKDGKPPYETVLLGNLFTFAVGLPFFFIDPPQAQALAPIAIMGVFQAGIPYIFYVMASKNARTIDLTILPMLEPVMNPVWVYLGTGEAPGIRSLVGGGILLAVVVAQSLFSVRTQEE
ncbi:MAG: DMT family transporter [Clostridiales Family XIII bacterium]|jgi:drug/metabolite transporter (DMT)-like permease|nr:DMT family transporter [Clostridiales Family XIII bacterium]